MTFASRITRTPIAYEVERSQDLGDRFSGQPPEVCALLEGAAGCSPYLLGLIQREADWLDPALSSSPEDALDQIIADAQGHAHDTLGAALRVAKRRVALLSGLADLGGVWPLESVTAALTRLADTGVDLAMKALVGEEIRRGKLPGATPEDAATAGGMVCLAMGKMGAGELNYSSDIDLICLFDEARFDGQDVQDARASFIRVTRKMTAMLADLTGDGYVFRTDLRLRPDPSVTPVCLGMEAAEHYYESVGRTWERAAYIKARPCGGDIAAGERFLAMLTPFVWRKHLDFAAIQDAHDMRLRIREHKGLHGPIVLEGHNMKLGRGGIREIEFFTQTRQLIAGGRDPELRLRGTVEGLAALTTKGWVPEDVTEELTRAYRAHREIEHRLQMIGDVQTHDLPNTPEGFDRIARMTGASDTEVFRRDIRDRLARVHELTEGFFAPTAAEPGPELSKASRAVVDGWRGYPALRSGRSVAIFKRLEPEILSRLTRAANPDEALLQFDGFLSGLPAGVQVFSLFEANPQLIDLIVDICTTAPGLARHLSRNAGVLDAVIVGDFFSDWPGMAALQAQLAAVLQEVPDYERKLDAARRWAKEWHFRIGVHHLRGLIDASVAGREYADLAEACVAALCQPCIDEFAHKHGQPPGRGAVVLGMGSLGAGRLNAASDLDLIVIYDPAGVENSDGPRPLSSRAYYARLTQAMVTAVSAQLPEGRLYEVDMRLRPSGRSGPVATSLAAFRAYQLEEAWTWEHLALTRARALAGDQGLAIEVEQVRCEVLEAKARGKTVLSDVAEMRARIFSAKAPDGAWEAKIGPGRLQDIELLAQTCALRAGSDARRVEAQLRLGPRSGLIDQKEVEVLQRAYRLLWRLQAGGRLLTDKPLDLDAIGEGGRSFLLRETGFDGLSALAAALEDETRAADAVIAKALAADATEESGKDSGGAAD